VYRERVGALITIGENESRADAAMSQVLQIARSIYSMPPDHGAAIAAHVFADPALKEEWIRELYVMRTRIAEMRGLLAAQLQRATGGRTFDFIRAQHGMFSLLGVPPETVERLRERHHIYMTSDSRMNLAGIMPHNAGYVADAIAAELLT
jgi:aspartate/tyrosine/aromatic aminotransferase